MNSSPYELNAIGSDDETYQFVVSFELMDGSAFPFDQYEIEYSVKNGGSTCLRLTQGNGVTVEAPFVAFKAARGSLHCGEYQHGCRVRHLPSDDEFQVFDGIVSIGEGNF